MYFESSLEVKMIFELCNLHTKIIFELCNP